MRGNRRYVMSRFNRRVAPPGDESSLPSADTAFLSKLIKTGDTSFIDDLARNIPEGLPPVTKDEFKYSKQPRRWHYVLLGMGLMYLFIVLSEARKTKDWWKFYMINLKESQLTSADSVGLRGVTRIEAIDRPQQSLFKSTTWQQSGSASASANGAGSMFDSNQQQQYPQIAGGFSSGTLNQQQQYPRIAGGLSSGILGQQQLYPPIAGGLSSGILGQQQLYPPIAGGLRSGNLGGGSTTMNSGSSTMQSYSNTGDTSNQATSLFGRANNNGLSSSAGGTMLQSSPTNNLGNRALGGIINDNSPMFEKNKQLTGGQLVVADNFAQQGVGQPQPQQQRSLTMQPYGNQVGTSNQATSLLRRANNNGLSSSAGGTMLQSSTTNNLGNRAIGASGITIGNNPMLGQNKQLNGGQLAVADNFAQQGVRQMQQHQNQHQLANRYGLQP